MIDPSRGGKFGRLPAHPSAPATAGPSRSVFESTLTSPEPGFMLVRGSGMGFNHNIESASGRSRKAISYSTTPFDTDIAVD